MQKSIFDYIADRCYIDSRELLEARDTIQQEIDDATAAMTDEIATKAEREEARHDYAQLCEVRDTLAAINSEGSNYDDWQWGTQLISNDVFTDYAQEMCEDITDIDTSRWPFTHIDWDAAARDLQQDYTQFFIDDELYWIRS